MTKEEVENIKYRLSDIGVKVGELALEYISELEKENAELREDLQTAIVANQQWLKRDTRLEEQIEKMKCCGNCKHSFSNDIGCMQRARNKYCDNLELWEPVE